MSEKAAGKPSHGRAFNLDSERGVSRVIDSATSPPLRFSIRQVLLATTALAVALAVLFQAPEAVACVFAIAASVIGFGSCLTLLVFATGTKRAAAVGAAPAATIAFFGAALPLLGFMIGRPSSSSGDQVFEFLVAYSDRLRFSVFALMVIAFVSAVISANIARAHATARHPKNSGRPTEV